MQKAALSKGGEQSVVGDDLTPSRQWSVWGQSGGLAWGLGFRV